jgi:hypothetical protein
MNLEQTERSSCLEELKSEIQSRAKNGIDFILAASVAWIGIFLIWKYTAFSSYDKSVLTLIMSAVLIPLAFGFQKS